MKVLVIAFVGYLVMATVLAYSLRYLGIPTPFIACANYILAMGILGPTIYVAFPDKENAE